MQTHRSSKSNWPNMVINWMQIQLNFIMDAEYLFFSDSVHSTNRDEFFFFVCFSSVTYIVIAFIISFFMRCTVLFFFFFISWDSITNFAWNSGKMPNTLVPAFLFMKNESFVTKFLKTHAYTEIHSYTFWWINLHNAQYEKWKKKKMLKTHSSDNAQDSVFVPHSYKF